MVGILDGFVADKARTHDLHQTMLVTEVMEREFQALLSTASIEDAIELILRNHQRLIPILDKKLHVDNNGLENSTQPIYITTLKGVVSRADILNLLMSMPSRFPLIVPACIDKSVCISYFSYTYCATKLSKRVHVYIPERLYSGYILNTMIL